MFLLLIFSVNMTGKLTRAIFSVERYISPGHNARNFFLLWNFHLTIEGKNCLHAGNFGSRYGFDKCFPQCHQDWRLQLLWKF